MPPPGPSRGSGRGRGRRPAGEVRADVLSAVGELVLTEGVANLTFDRVAKLARVSKTTLYKWWPSPGALALDGYVHAVEQTLAFEDTHDIRRDLRNQLHAFADVMATPGGRALLELIGASQTDPDLATAYRALYSTRRRELAADRLTRAQHEGQIRPGVDVQVVVDQLWGATYHRLLIPDEPVTATFLDALVDNLFDGIGA
jgi:AcrR family transcriptional regulator